jgi:general secretion pathway protein I
MMAANPLPKGTTEPWNHGIFSVVRTTEARKHGIVSEDHPLHSERDGAGVEIDEESHTLLRQREVGQQLRLVNRQQLLNRFELDDDRVLNDKVHSVERIEAMALVNNGNGNLLLKADTPARQLDRDTLLVDRLEKSRPELFVHVDACTEDALRNLKTNLPWFRASVVHTPCRQKGGASCAGFTLLEVMVALAILGLALTAILSAQAGLYNANVQARNITQATSAARCKMSEIEADLLTKGYPETDLNEDGPCCVGESPGGMSCKWSIERVVLPDPPKTQNLDAGPSPAGSAGGGAGGLGALGALAGAAGNPGALADGGLSALTSALATPTGPGGQTGSAGIAGMAMGIVYPQLKPLLEASIRRVTLDVMWNEGPNARTVHVVQFVVHPNKGLPPILDPSMAGAAAGSAAPTVGGTGLATPPALNPIAPGGLPR